MHIVVTMCEEVFHLCRGPLNAECLGILIGLALQYLLGECLWDVAMEGLRHDGELGELGEWLEGSYYCIVLVIIFWFI